MSSSSLDIVATKCQEQTSYVYDKESEFIEILLQTGQDKLATVIRETQDGTGSNIPEKESSAKKIKFSSATEDAHSSTPAGAMAAKLYNLQLGATSMESYQDTRRDESAVGRGVRPGDHPSVADKRRAVTEALQLGSISKKEEGRVMMDDDYMRECEDYSHGRRDTEPGPLRNTMIHKRATTRAISRPCADALIAVFGGAVASIMTHRLGGWVIAPEDGGAAEFLLVNFVGVDNDNRSTWLWCNPRVTLKYLVKYLYGREVVRAEDAKRREVEVTSKCEDWWPTAPVGLSGGKDLRVWLE